MNDPNIFIYNFVFELGSYKPIELTLLGSRFYTTYCENIPVNTEQFISDYKTFLHAKLNSANTLLSEANNDSRIFIEWIISFIETELINIEYREIYSAYSTSENSSSFSLIFNHIFFDPILFNAISPQKRLQSFVKRNSNLTNYLNDLKENITKLNIIILLELYQILNSMNQLYLQVENYFSSKNLNLTENQQYLQEKKNNLTIVENLISMIKENLLSFTSEEINFAQRQEIFTKTIEYFFPRTLNVDETVFQTIIDLKENIKDEICLKLSIDKDSTTIISELQKLRQSIKVQAKERLEKTKIIYNTILNDLSAISPIFKMQPVNLKPEKEYFQNFFFKPIYISTLRGKRQDPAEWLIPNEDTYEGSIYTEIVMNFIPFHIIVEKNNTTSYIYQALQLPETKEVVNHFIAYFLCLSNFSDEKSVLASLFYELLSLCELSLIDLSLQNQNKNRNELKSEMITKLSINEIGVEYYIHQLQQFPGSLFLQGYLFFHLIRNFNSLVKENSKYEAFEKLFPFLQKFYGAPVKLFLKNLNNLT